jgi:hypothetical protein
MKNKTHANTQSLAPLCPVKGVHSMGWLRVTRRKAGDEVAAVDDVRHRRLG